MAKKILIPVIIFLFMMLPGTGLNAQQQSSSEQQILIETALGDMVIRLYDETPLHRDNMIRLIREGFYRDLLFHRVIADFMIQGGDPDSRGAARGQRLGMGGPGYTVPSEFHGELIHKKGALAAARMGDQVNPEKASSGSQFYIVQGRVFTAEELNRMEQQGMAPLNRNARKAYTTLGGTPHLDGSYTVFGEVVKGLEVLDRIAGVTTDASDRPLEDVIFSISLIQQ